MKNQAPTPAVMDEEEEPKIPVEEEEVNEEDVPGEPPATDEEI